MTIKPGNIPQGWKRGEDVCIERVGDTIVIRQHVMQVSYHESHLFLVDVDHLRFALDDFPTEWLHWWYNMPYEPMVTLREAKWCLEHQRADHNKTVERLVGDYNRIINADRLRFLVISAAVVVVFTLAEVLR